MKYTIRLLYLLVLICLAGLQFGCKKQSAGRSCPEILSERPPQMISIRVLDKLTGKNLITAGGLQRPDINIVDPVSGSTIKHWGLKPDALGADGDHILEMIISQDKSANITYQISIGNYGDVRLEFEYKRYPPSRPCSPGYYKAGNFKFPYNDFEQLKVGNQVYQDFFIVKI